MAALIDSQQIAPDLRIELYEGGETWLIRYGWVETSEQPKGELKLGERGTKLIQEIKLDAAASTQLLAFLQLRQERLTREAHADRGGI